MVSSANPSTNASAAAAATLAARRTDRDAGAANGAAGGQSETYTVSGTLENDVETNPDLSVPVGGLTPKYVLLLKRFFRFTVAPTNPGQGVAVAMFHNKTLGE